MNLKKNRLKRRKIELDKGARITPFTSSSNPTHFLNI